jgi:hypothetical protein
MTDIARTNYMVCRGSLYEEAICKELEAQFGVSWKGEGIDRNRED